MFSRSKPKEPFNPHLSLPELQRNELSHAIVKIAVALGITEGTQKLNYDQVLLLAEESRGWIAKLNTDYAQTRAAKVEAALRPTDLEAKEKPQFKRKEP